MASLEVVIQLLASVLSGVLPDDAWGSASSAEWFTSGLTFTYILSCGEHAVLC